MFEDFLKKDTAANIDTEAGLPEDVADEPQSADITDAINEASDPEHDPENDLPMAA